MYWINKENNRYYSAFVSSDIFGHCSIMKSWGGINSKKGNGSTEPCGCKKAAQLRIEEIKKERAAHGYSLIND